MSTRSKMIQALLIAAMAAAGCGSQAQEQRVAPMEKSKGAAPQAATPGERAAPATPAPPDKEKEKRGNTPPGKTRAGDGPLDGAIVDPSGVVTK